MTTKKQHSQDEKLKTILEQIGPEFVEDGAKGVGPEQIAEVVSDIDALRQEFGKGSLERFKKDAKLLTGLLEDYWDGRYTNVPFWTVAVIGFMGLYVLKPIDIIPDSLPVIGQLDDAIVVAHTIGMVKKELHAYKIWKLASELDVQEAGHS